MDEYFTIIVFWLIGVIGLFLVVLILLLFIRRHYRNKEKHILLQVQVSKENELGPIVAEQIYASIHNADEKSSFWNKLIGSGFNRISLEIAHTQRVIKFYFWIPEKLKNLVEGQIYAQYSDVEILEVPDYVSSPVIELSSPNEIASQNKSLQSFVTSQNADRHFKKISPEQLIVTADLKLSSPDIFPIKRYPQFEDKLTRVAVDPIAGVTASLAVLENPTDEAWIQIVISPLQDKWRKVFFNCCRILHKGIFGNIESLQKMYANLFCTRSKWLRIIFFPLYILFFFQGLGSAQKNKGISILSDNTNRHSDSLQEELSKSHERESPLSAAVDKSSKFLFETNIRLAYLSRKKNQSFAIRKVKEIASSFKQFTIPHFNGFTISNISTKSLCRNYQNRSLSKPFVLNSEELATLYHLPNKIVQTPSIYWIKSKKLEPPGNLPRFQDSLADEITLLGKTNYRGIREEFGIKKEDRRRHMYIIGKTGMGKSTLLENMIFSDIQKGKGVGIVDPHGDLADKILHFIPARRTNHVVLIDPSDRDFPVAFNMLENVDSHLNTIVCSGLVGIFKKLYAESWGPRLEHILRNTILALLEYPNTTMLGITRMLQDTLFRKQVVAKITDPIVKSFWINEFAKFQGNQLTEAISPILNKVGQFLSSPIIRNIVGQPKSTINFRFAMDKSKIIIVNLSKGKIGEDISSLLGSMIITKFQLDAMSRADVSESERKDFYLYVDEFQNFATDSFATILSEARKYRLNLTMANQFIAQMPEEVRDAVFGNVGSILSFQIGFTDAEFLAGQFSEQVTENDLVSLSKYTAYAKILIDGMPTPTFSFETLPPPSIEATQDAKDKILRVVREKYSAPRLLVEEKIKRWHENALKRVEEEGKKKLKIKN